MRQIIKILPKEDRQTMLFSATQTTKVEDLARISLRPGPLYINVDEEKQFSTVEGLDQGYVIVDADKRFLLLFSFLKKMAKKKIIVFFSSCNSVKYYSELLQYIDLQVLDLHGKQKQQKRTNTFFEFCNAKQGTLICTDVAARGLDIPAVDWIVQFDPPDDPRDYIHRVGRTARGNNTKGRSLLFLQPGEVGFLAHLKAAKVPVVEYDFPKNKIMNVQSQLEKLIGSNYYLNQSAKDGYRSYLHAYASHSLRSVFDIHKLDLVKVAKVSTHPPTHSQCLNIANEKTELRIRDASEGRHYAGGGHEQGQEDGRETRVRQPAGPGHQGASSEAVVRCSHRMDTHASRQFNYCTLNMLTALAFMREKESCFVVICVKPCQSMQVMSSEARRTSHMHPIQVRPPSL